jgi:hypothetical protein
LCRLALVTGCVFHGFSVDGEGMHDANDAQTYAQTVLADAPLAYWRLGDSSGTTARDSSSHNHDGAYGGAPTLGVPGALSEPDTAVNFDGVDDRMAASLPGLTGNQSVEAWVNYTTAPGTSGDIATCGTLQVDGMNEGVFLRYAFQNTQLQFNVADGLGNRVTIDGPVKNDGAWHHVVGVKGTTDIRLYVDSELIGSAAITGFRPYAAGEAAVGWASGGGRFQGSIDDVAIYDNELTVDRVAAHYASR